MVKIFVTDPSGIEHEIEADEGLSVMEAIKDADLDGVAAICGGCCSCATCHVHVDGEWMDHLDPREEDEEDLLEDAEGADETSRLSCQIQITGALDGLKVSIEESN